MATYREETRVLEGDIRQVWQNAKREGFRRLVSEKGQDHRSSRNHTSIVNNNHRMYREGGIIRAQSGGSEQIQVWRGESM